MIILFVALLLVPNPRLRDRTHIREYFPAPTHSGMAMMAGAVVVVAVVMVTTLDTVSLISYGPVFSLGIVALSLVPLVGFAGQISLAQLSFGRWAPSPWPTTVSADHHSGWCWRSCSPRWSA
ncbi:MAG: hypothetical protein R2714_07230 [Microthrixaceae bacterium]